MTTRSATTRFLLTMAALALVASAFALIASQGNAASSARAAKPVEVNTVGNTKVFATPGGKTLYSPVQEKSGKVLCVGSCTSVWKPLKTTAKTAQLAAIHAGLGTIKRPDGSKQIAFHNHPLYSFSFEGAGKLTGDGVKDVFAGNHFTWRAAKLSGGASTGTPSPPYTPAPPYPGGFGY